MCTREEQETFASDGFVVVKHVITKQKAEETAVSVLDESLQIALQGEDLEKIRREMSPVPLSSLLTNPTLRIQHLKNPKCIWKDGNPLKPFVSKNCGMSNLYYNPLVRQNITFNPVVHGVLSSMYEVLIEGEVKEKEPILLVYSRGPDRVGVKPRGATDMPRHLDKHLFYKTKDEPKHRVQSFVCLRSVCRERHTTYDSVTQKAGGIEILARFHKVFELASIYFKGKLNKKAHSGAVPQELGKEFDKFLPDFIQWCKTLCMPLILQEQSVEVQAAFQRASTQHGLCVDDIDNIKWVRPVVCAGDMVGFDQRLPHRNVANTTDVERIVAYVSLFIDTRPEGEQTSLVSHFQGISDGQGQKHSGSNRDNAAERKVFATTWANRIALPTPKEPEAFEIARKTLCMAETETETTGAHPDQEHSHSRKRVRLEE